MSRASLRGEPMQWVSARVRRLLPPWGLNRGYSPPAKMIPSRDINILWITWGEGPRACGAHPFGNILPLGWRWVFEFERIGTGERMGQTGCQMNRLCSR